MRIDVFELPEGVEAIDRSHVQFRTRLAVEMITDTDEFVMACEDKWLGFRCPFAEGEAPRQDRQRGRAEAGVLARDDL